MIFNLEKWSCVCVVAAAAYTLDYLTHLVHPGQRAHVLPGSIAASSERAPVPQGAFLPQSVIQDETLLTPLVTKPIEIHGCLQLQRGPQSSARTCSSSSSFRGSVVWPCCATENRKCQSGNPHHVTSVVDSHLQVRVPCCCFRGIVFHFVRNQ